MQSNNLPYQNGSRNMHSQRYQSTLLNVYDDEPTEQGYGYMPNYNYPSQNGYGRSDSQQKSYLDQYSGRENTRHSNYPQGNFARPNNHQSQIYPIDSSEKNNDKPSNSAHIGLQLNLEGRQAHHMEPATPVDPQIYLPSLIGSGQLQEGRKPQTMFKIVKEPTSEIESCNKTYKIVGEEVSKNTSHKNMVMEKIEKYRQNDTAAEENMRRESRGPKDGGAMDEDDDFLNDSNNKNLRYYNTAICEYCFEHGK